MGIINKQVIECLTTREQEVFDLILEFNTEKEISESIFISLSTVKTHKRNILNKLDCQNSIELRKKYIYSGTHT